MVKNLPSSAGDEGSIPHLGTKIPYAAGQLLSPRTTAREVQVQQQRAHGPHLRCSQRNKILKIEKT